MRDSLHPEVTNALPDVYHRPQQGSGLKVEPSNFKLKNFESMDYRFPSYENPAVNSLKAFEPVRADNLLVTRNFVVNYNRDVIRKTGKDTKPVQDIGLLAKAWQADVEDYNICGRCKQPIKTFTASILRLPAILAHVKTTYGNSPEIKDLEHSLSEYRKGMKTRKRKRSASNDMWKVEFKSVLWQKSSTLPTIVYAYCKSYYVPYSKADGKLAYRYEDGTGRHIETRYKTRHFTYNKVNREGQSYRVTKERRLPYFVEVLPDGTEIPTIAKSEFASFFKKCTCDFRKRLLEEAKNKKGR